MKIFGKEISKKDILKRIGDITQLGEIKYYKFIDGVSRGVRGIDIKSPCGLDMTVLPDRGMDISYLAYKSIPISWKSATKETSPVYYESRGEEWLRTFYAGLLTTCGLTYMGDPCIDEGEELGTHGRISNISAEHISMDGYWYNDIYVMVIKGKVREAKVFGDKIQLERKITTWMDTPKIVVEDIIENIGFNRSPLMVLYHVNIGYPVIDKESKLISPKSNVTPRDKEARKEINNYFNFSDPVPNYKEQVFFHEIEADSEGNSNITIINESFNNGEGIGIWLKFNKNNLPYLIQWKNLSEGEYVCGIEPANSLIRGRKIEREEGTLKFIEPGESIYYRLEFNILTSKKDIDKFKERYLDKNI